MARGAHKNSIKNLTHEGRPLEYGEPKTGHRVTVTQTGWNSAKQLIASMVTVIKTEELSAIEDAIESALLRQAIAQTNNDFLSISEVLSEHQLELTDLDG
jgi:hypothetical protein